MKQVRLLTLSLCLVAAASVTVACGPTTATPRTTAAPVSLPAHVAGPPRPCPECLDITTPPPGPTSSAGAVPVVAALPRAGLL